MIEGLFNQPGYLAAKRLLDVTAMRQQAIASNLANVETPGYRRIDVAPSFNQELQRAIGSGDAAALARLAPRLEVDPTALAANSDGNTVQLESELVKLQQNSLAHAVETQFISGSFARLRLAISGRGS
jgi:flagellar basal-body rod protein FlgB